MGKKWKPRCVLSRKDGSTDFGNGDIVSLVEKAQEQFDETEAKKIEKKIKQNKFDFNDFVIQLQQIKKWEI